ncbi:hypothetical protein GVAV_002782 [Gurleya vavrai]
MDRILEYNLLIDKKNNFEFIKSKNDKFYDSIMKNLCNLENSISKNSKYVDLLVLQEKYNKTLQETRLIFTSINVEANRDEEMHFEGIKAIINIKLNKIEKRLKNAKQNSMKLKIELEPETYKSNYKENEFNLQLEEENKKLVKKYVESSIQATRKRVVEIQEIQNLIGLHIEAQDERIDNVNLDTKKAKEHIKGSKKYLGKGNGKLARRILFLFILCLTFVIFFFAFTIPKIKNFFIFNEYF